MLPSVELLINVLVTVVAAAAVYAVWVANRKRISAETVGRAEEQALRIVKDADRDAETRKKEALLDAKEKAHEILMEADHRARQERQQAAALEQARAVDENQRLSQELGAARARLATNDLLSSELSTIREERDVIRARVTDMLEQLEALSL